MPNPTLNPNVTDRSSPLAEAIKTTLSFCRESEWAGYDPYDALNSRLFARTPFKRSRFCRLALTQGLKRLPLNLRPILQVPKEQNPKGIALFCSASIKLSRLGFTGEQEAQALLDRLIALKSPGWDHACWGYHFDWQTRTYLVPKFTPNIICTTFAGNALLDGYDAFGREELLEHAVSSAEFLLKGLNTTNGKAGFCFSYTTLDRSQIHNANLLGAAFLARVYQHTRSEELLSKALEAARFSVDLQKDDGSWPYGEGKHQGWIDSFHTGYNLGALEVLRACLPDGLWVAASLQKGLRFFLENFFTQDGVVKYDHDRIYPIDIHAIAQAIITLVEFREYDPGAATLAKKICDWSLGHMRNRSGEFIFQRHRLFKNPISYIRWGQAWMLLAMASLFEASCEGLS